MIDTHCHLNFPELESQIADVMKRANEAGVTKFVVPSTGIETATSSVNLSEIYPAVKTAIGVHPVHAHEFNHDDMPQLVDYVEGINGVVAIGEVGLDYYHMEDCKTEEEKEARKQLQQVFFIEMITLAKDYHLPLIIHSREAFDDTLQILEEQAPNHPVVIHCFTGTKEEAQKWLDMGYLLSFTGIITYKKNDALREVVKMVPLEQLMLETDAPFLAPEGHRKETCEPMYVRDVAQCVAGIKGITLEEVDEVTTETAESFFSI